jgi:hypothetical protein
MFKNIFNCFICCKWYDFIRETIFVVVHCTVNISFIEYCLLKKYSLLLFPIKPVYTCVYEHKGDIVSTPPTLSFYTILLVKGKALALNGLNEINKK